MSDQGQSDLVVWGSATLALLVALAGVARIVVGHGLEDRLGTTTLTYFAVAGALLMLRWVKSLSVGVTKVEFRGLEEKTAQAMEMAKAADDASRRSALSTGQGGTEAIARTVERGADSDDPWRGQFGDPEANGRRLSAQVESLIGDRGWFLIRLMVESLDRSRPLAGSVQFYLHDSFPNPIRTIPVVAGKAELRLRAWGAFTVGVLADGGQTSLELNLAENTSFSKLFRQR